MKKKYFILAAFLIGASLIISAVIYLFVSDYKNSKDKVKQEEKKITDKIHSDNKAQEERVNELNKNLLELRTDIVEYIDTYESMYDKHDDFIEKLNAVEKMLDESFEKTKFLNEKCKDRYSDSESNTVCVNYYINLEEISNVYVFIYKSTSKKVSEFNEWLKEYTGDKKMEEISIFESKYKEYVDLNNDKTFLGMIED